jgi:VCBS repeat-containing protein
LNFVGKFGSHADFGPSSHGHIDSLSKGAEPVTVPDAHLLFSGDYERSGTDLIISDQLHRVVVPNYFHGDKRPALVSPEGAPLDPKVVDALTGHVQYAQAAGTAAAAKVVGHVVKMTGSASIVRNGVTIDVNNGDIVYQNDVVQTGSGSTLGLVMIDGTTFNLTANARLMMNDLTYDATSTSNTSLFTLVQGAATFVAGQVAKTGDMKVSTPVATMGIRGTAVILDINAIDGTVSVSVVNQRDGQIHALQVYNARGDLIGTVTSNGSSLTLRPTASFEVIAQESNKTVAQVLTEFNAFQQLLSTYEIGKQLVPNTPFPTDGRRGDNTQQPLTKFAGSTISPIDSTTTKFNADIGGSKDAKSGAGTGDATTLKLAGDGTGLVTKVAVTVGDGPVQFVEVAATSVPFVVTPSPVSRISSGPGDHFGPAMSADGQFVTYDPDGAIYLFDRQTGATKTIASPGEGFTYGSPTISSDGHFLVYQGSDGTRSWIFIYNNDASDPAHYGQITRLMSGGQAAISGDGSKLVIEQGGSIGLYDQQGHELANITGAAVGIAGTLWKPAISADGHVIAFWSSDSSSPGAAGQLFTYDLSTATVRSIASTATDAGNSAASFSADGHYVVYQSDAPGGHSEIYLYDLRAGQVVFHTANPEPSYNPVLSPDGHFIILASDARLTADDKNAVTDIYVVDVTDPSHPAYKLVSVLDDGTQGDDASNLGAAISAGGQFIAFGSRASNFSSGDAPGTGDIFVVDPSSGHSAIILEGRHSPAVLTASGVITLTGDHGGVTLGVSDSRITASFDAHGDIQWSFNEPRSDFASLQPGEISVQRFVITLSTDRSTTEIPVKVSIYDVDQPVVSVADAAPVASPVTLAAGTEDTGYTITSAALLAGVADIDGPSLSINAVAILSGGGAIADNHDGTFRYTPAPNYNGPVEFSYTASDGTLSASSTATLDIAGVNDAPTVTKAKFAVSEGGTVVLGAANIGVGDPDSASFTFTASGVTHGRFQTTTDGNSWSDATTFTTAGLSAGHVRFVHDGGHATPTFSIQADDGAATHNLSSVFTGSVDFTIVDSVPVIDHASLTVSQGGTVTLTTADIGFTDSDDAVVNYTVSNLSHGHFEIIDGNVAQAVTSFTSDDVATGRVAFVHDGSSGVPTFSLTPNDGLTNGTTVAGAVTFSAANYTLTSTEGVSINVSTEGATSGFVFPGAGNVTTPGIPEDRIAIGYDVGRSHVVLDNAPLLGVNQMTPLSSETHSLGDTTFVSTTLDAGHGVTLVQTLALGNDANFFTTTIDITNGGTSDISNLRFLRNFDPDQDVQAHNDYKTFNDVVQNPNGAETFAIVSATGVESGTKVAMVGFGAEWRASVFGFTNTDPYATHAFDAPTDPNGAKADLSMSLTSSLGTLTAGSHVQITYVTTNNVATTGSNALYGTTGADTIDGLGGDDLLIGLGGADTFVFESGYGHNTIEDFGHSDGDRIDLTGVIGVHGINDLQITPNGVDTIIDLGNGDSLTLANVSANSLVAGDFMFAAVNHAPQFVTDATVTQLAVPANGVPFGRGEIFAFGPSLSSDGRYTVFGANNTVPGPDNGNSDLGDVYLYDRQTGSYKWISDPANFTNSHITLHSGETFDGLSTISRDGQTVAFKGEYQTTQVFNGQPFTFTQSEIFLYSTSTGLITLVPGLTGDEPSLGGSGNAIASQGQSLTIPAGNTIAYNDVLVTDRAGHVLTRISGDTNASPVESQDVSADGRYVTFWTTASQIEVKNIRPTGGPLDSLTFNVGATYPADPSAPSGPIAQVYVFDRQTETINLVSVSPDGHMGNGSSGALSIQSFNGFLDLGDDWKSAISADDRFILFQSNASNLVSGDSNGTPDVFLYDLQTREVQLVSAAADGSAANGTSYRPALSPDGNYVAFASDATNLLGASATPAGTDGFQTYVREIDPSTGLVSTGFDGFHNGDSQYGVSVNRGGGFVAFSGAALAFNPNQGQAELLSVAAGTVKFSGGSISDYNPAADMLTITVSVAHGTLTPVVAITPGGGLTIVGGFDGSKGTLAFTGSIDAINQALQSGAIYTPTTTGPDTMTMTLTDGNGGTATQTTQFNPHAPQITGSFSINGAAFITFDHDQPQAELLAQGQVKFFGESISDPNPAFNPNADALTVTVNVGHGTLTPVSLGSLSIVGRLDGSNGILEFTGSIGDVKQAMKSGAIYTATPGGPDAITIVVTDGHGGVAVQSTQFNSQAPHIDVGSTSGQYNVFLVDQSGGTQGVVLEDSSFSAPNSGTLFTNGAFGFTDADPTDTHTATVIGSPVVDASHAGGFVVPSGGLGTFTPLAVTESAGSGQVPWTFTVDDALVQGLGLGQYVTETYAVRLDDHHGGHPTQDVTVIIAGANDAPVIGTDNLTVAQNGSNTTLTGLSVSDIDTSDNQFTMRATAGSGVVSPATDTGSLAQLNLDFLNNGIVYTPGGPAPVTDRVTVTVADNAGATDIVNVIFNVTGSGNVTLQGTPGKDVIFATGYQDTLTGGAGADQFVFASHTGNDTITDFTPGQDKIRLDYHAFDAVGQNDFSSWLRTHATPSGSDVLIDLNVNGLQPGVDTILLKNVAIATLHAGDFHVV